ncbi:MAG: YciI family protein [Nocardioides sp.]
MELESYSFVLLRRGPRAGEYDDAELERLQAAHLGFLDQMRDAGHLVLAGPFSDQLDETLRGLCVYVTDLATTRDLAATDPSVQAGRMAVEVMTWWTLQGAVTFHPEVRHG